MSIAIRENGLVPPDVPLADIDLRSWDFWHRGDVARDGAFATLRREAPITFWPEVPGEQVFEVYGGHWALTKHDDIAYVSRHPEIFSSSPSITIRDWPAEAAEFMGSMLVLDDPRHQRLRSIVSRAFTPKVLARIDVAVRERARRLVSHMVAKHSDGAGELVSELAGPLPLQVICDMMGIPEADHEQIFHWTNVMIGYTDPELSNYEEFVRAALAMASYATELAEERRVNPHDDLTTSLVQAEVDGDRLSTAEIASFFILLVAAGNETTRNAISHGVLALSRYPEQREKWWADFDVLSRTAVEEIVRWGSPLIYMRRTVIQDVEMSGNKLAVGDKVTMWYCSANRDESKYADPWLFDVSRDPNPHFGYGGGGVHFCLGANLARREIGVAFDELHRQIPDIVATEEPTRLLSPFIHGIKTLPVAWTPPR